MNANRYNSKLKKIIDQKKLNINIEKTVDF